MKTFDAIRLSLLVISLTQPMIRPDVPVDSASGIASSKFQVSQLHHYSTWRFGSSVCSEKRRCTVHGFVVMPVACAARYRATTSIAPQSHLKVARQNTTVIHTRQRKKRARARKRLAAGPGGRARHQHATLHPSKVAPKPMLAHELLHGWNSAAQSDAVLAQKPRAGRPDPHPSLAAPTATSTQPCTQAETHLTQAHTTTAANRMTQCSKRPRARKPRAPSPWARCKKPCTAA